VPLLRELGYLPGGKAGPQNRVCDDPTCLEMLKDDLDEGRSWLLLFLEGGRPDRDCVTNASGVWLWKHFYM
jgi:hypothetical protein